MPENLDPLNQLDLQRRLERSRDEMQIIREFSVAIHAQRDAAALYPLLYQLASRAMTSDAAFIALYDPEARRMETVFLIDKGVEYPAEGASWEASEISPIGWIISHAAPLRFDNFNEELAARFPEYVAARHDLDFGDTDDPSRSWMTVPMLIDRTCTGVVNVQSYQAGVYGEREERILLTLGSMLAIAIEHARLVAQREAWLRALSAPLIPVSDHVLILPLIGRLDQDRIAIVRQSLLPHVERRRIQHIVLDMTGVVGMTQEASLGLDQIIRTLALLGARCVLSGLRPELAGDLTREGHGLVQATMARNVEQGLAMNASIPGKGRRQ